LLGGLAVGVKLPVPLRAVIGGVKNRVVEKGVGYALGHANLTFQCVCSPDKQKWNCMICGAEIHSVDRFIDIVLTPPYLKVS